MLMSINQGIYIPALVLVAHTYRNTHKHNQLPLKESRSRSVLSPAIWEFWQNSEGLTHLWAEPSLTAHLFTNCSILFDFIIKT